MSNKSHFAANKMLDKQFGGADYTPAPTVYVALMTASPTAAGGGTEVTGGSYARAAVTNNATNFPAAVNGQKSNATLIQFAQASAPWGSVVAVAIYDASSGGNLLRFITLTDPITVNTGTQLDFPIGSLVLIEK